MFVPEVHEHPASFLIPYSYHCFETLVHESLGTRLPAIIPKLIVLLRTEIILHESVLCLAFVMVFISGPCVELCWSHRRILLTLKCKTLWLELAFACVTLLSTNFSDPCKCCWSRKPDPLPQRREGSGGLRMQAMSRRNAISWMTYPDFEITCCEVRTLSEPYISTTLR